MSNRRKIPFFDYTHVFNSNEESFVQIFRDVGRRGAFIMQRDLEEFELNLAEYTGARYAIGVANATDGLQLSLMAGGIEPGDEVIISSHTMVATASAVHFAGGVPIPAEAGSDHLIDPESVRAVISPKTRAIMPTQLNGRTANMDVIRDIAEEHGLLVFEDAAQALGSKFKEQSAGTFGIAAAISFYPAKLLGALGDAGAVLTSEPDVYERLNLLRDHGRNAQGGVECWAFNSRLDNLQAALLSHQLRTYGRVVARRREIAQRYQDNLDDVPELILPPAPGSDPDHFDVFQNYEIEADYRNDLKEYLRDRGVGTLLPWGGRAVHQFKKLGFEAQLPATDRLFGRVLMIPMNMSLADGDIDYVSEQIRSFYGN